MILPKDKRRAAPDLLAVRLDDPHAFLVRLQREDFVSFVLGGYPHIRGGASLLHNWHLDAMAYELERIIKGSNNNLLVTVPPRMLKSILISVMWVAWCLGRDPALSFVCVSYAQGLSSKHARDCRGLMQSRWYRQIFPGTKIRSSRTAVDDFETTRGGGRLATSIGGTLTGRGGDFIIIDDPLNPDEANSTVKRDGVNEWYRSTLPSRLNDKAKGAIITVMQRLHQFDAAGFLIDEGLTHVLSMPAIAVEDQRIPLTRGRVHVRKVGDVLHPAHEPAEALDKTKRQLGPYNFAAQYQQDPVPAEGNIVKAAWIKRYGSAFDFERSPGHYVMSMDTASKDNALNDYTAIIIAHVDRTIVRVVDVVRAKMLFPELERETIRLARAYKVKTLLIEDQASGQALIQTLRGNSPLGVPHPIAIRPTGDKVSRMMGVSGQIAAGQLLVPEDAPWLHEFLSEILSFPSGRYKDQADALTQLMNWVMLQQSYRSDECLAGPELFDINTPLVDYDPDDDPWL